MKSAHVVFLVATASLLAACGSAPKRKGPPPEFDIFSQCTKDLKLEGFSTISHNIRVVNGVAAPVTFDSFGLGEREMTEAETEQMRQCYDAKIASGIPAAPGG